MKTRRPETRERLWPSGQPLGGSPNWSWHSAVNREQYGFEARTPRNTAAVVQLADTPDMGSGKGANDTLGGSNPPGGTRLLHQVSQMCKLVNPFTSPWCRSW